MHDALQDVLPQLDDYYGTEEEEGYEQLKKVYKSCPAGSFRDPITNKCRRWPGWYGGILFGRHTAIMTAFVGCFVDSPSGFRELDIVNI